MIAALWLMVGSAMLALALFLAAMLSGEQHDDLVLKEWHHEYLGLLIQAFGIVPYLLAISPILQAFALLVILIGDLIQWDDSLQHGAQRWTAAGPQHRSALWWMWHRVVHGPPTGEPT